MYVKKVVQDVSLRYSSVERTERGFSKGVWKAVVTEIKPRRVQKPSKQRVSKRRQ